MFGNTHIRTSGTGMSIHPPPVACPVLSGHGAAWHLWQSNLNLRRHGCHSDSVVQPKNELLICFKIDTSLPEGAPKKKTAISRVKWHFTYRGLFHPQLSMDKAVYRGRMQLVGAHLVVYIYIYKSKVVRDPILMISWWWTRWRFFVKNLFWIVLYPQIFGGKDATWQPCAGKNAAT